MAEKSDIGSQEATVHVLDFSRRVARVSLLGWRNLVALYNDNTHMETHGIATRRCLCNCEKKKKDRIVTLGIVRGPNRVMSLDDVYMST